MKKLVMSLIICILLVGVGSADVNNLTLEASSPQWLYWEWDTPSDVEFNSSMVHINGIYLLQISP